MKGRALAVFKFLAKRERSSYREAADALGLSVRAVRYDVESINDELSLKRLPLIEKGAKGQLRLAAFPSLSVFDEAGYIWSGEDRAQLLRLTALFKMEDFNLRKLMELTEVSRRSLQNDVAEVQRELAARGAVLRYEKRYSLTGEPELLFAARAAELGRLVPLLRRAQGLSVCERYFKDFVEGILAPAPLASLLKWTDESIAAMGWALSDSSYRWYAASVLTFAYLALRGELPAPCLATPKLPDQDTSRRGLIYQAHEQADASSAGSINRTPTDSELPATCLATPQLPDQGTPRRGLIHQAHEQADASSAGSINRTPTDFSPEGVRRLEKILGVSLSPAAQELLGSFSAYLSKYTALDLRQDFISIEELSLYLMRRMEDELSLDFKSDTILLKGLLNHLGPMMERLRSGVALPEELPAIGEKYAYVEERLAAILKEQELFARLSPDEARYLALHFIGSIRRMEESRFRTVLLICGYGYGTTALVKDALISSYQVVVRDCISAYQAATYAHWEEIDLVISTVRTALPVEKKLLLVNVIFTPEDYMKLDLAGLSRRAMLPNFFRLERKLGFLAPEVLGRVMGVIREELGYKNVRMPRKYSRLTDLLTPSDLVVVKGLADWREAVHLSAGVLAMQGKTSAGYEESIMTSLTEQGFYCVTDGVFALLHGRGSESVHVSSMSLIVSRTPVAFGEKKVNLIFCLASRDKKEHIGAITRLMRMIQLTDLLKRLPAAKDRGEAFEIILQCEKEADPCSPS